MSLLAIYLQDHHAAAVAGTRLARRVASNVSSEDVSGDLSEVAEEIADDLAALETIMRRLGTRPSGVKDAIARGGEQLGRLKLNGRLRKRSPLSDVVELETLVVGITGKQALWVSLRSATSLPADELDHLVKRAERQKQIVERAREAAARRAFAPHGRSGEG
jgi:HAMP domain-containing protein